MLRFDFWPKRTKKVNGFGNSFWNLCWSDVWWMKRRWHWARFWFACIWKERSMSIRYMLQLKLCEWIEMVLLNLNFFQVAAMFMKPNSLFQLSLESSNPSGIFFRPNNKMCGRRSSYQFWSLSVIVLYFDLLASSSILQDVSTFRAQVRSIRWTRH